MVAKSANILARVEPEVKEQAEEISMVLPKELVTCDTMTIQEFNSVMETGLLQAKVDQSRPAADVIADLRRELQ